MGTVAGPFEGTIIALSKQDDNPRRGKLALSA
jgi:hypothetical protein